MYLDAVAGDILLLEELSAFVEAECHDGSDVRRVGDDGGVDVGFFDMVDGHEVGEPGGVVYLF